MHMNSSSSSFVREAVLLWNFKLEILDLALSFLLGWVLFFSQKVTSRDASVLLQHCSTYRYCYQFSFS